MTGSLKDGPQPQWYCPRHHLEGALELGLPERNAKSLEFIDGVWTPVPYVPHTEAGVAAA